jgi:hypothetical protein
VVKRNFGMIKNKFNIIYPPYVIILIILINFLSSNSAKAATIDVGGDFTSPITINSSVTNDYILYPTGTNPEGTVNFINKNNVVTGTLRGSTDGIGVINFTANYDRAVTNFGAINFALRLMDISSGSDITLNTASYVDTINMNNTGTVLTILNSLAASSSGVTHITTATDSANEIHLDSINETLDIGTSGFSISLVDVYNGALTLSNRAYIDTINLDDNGLSGTVNLNHSSGLIGNIKGNANGDGIANVYVDNSGTYFGASMSMRLGLLTVRDDATLTLDSATTSYVDNLILYNGATADGAVTLGNNNLYGIISGENDGDGTVNVTTTYTESNTTFGTITNGLGTLNIQTGGQMTGGGAGYATLYADILSLTGIFNLDGAATTVLPSTTNIRGETDGSGILNLNVSYNTLTDPTLGVSGNAIGTVNVATGLTLDLDSAAYISALNLVGTGVLDLNTGGQLNSTTVKGQTGTVNVNDNYNGSTYSTLFGTGAGIDSIGTLNVADTKTFTLSGISYINNLILGTDTNAATDATLTLASTSLMTGTIKG